MTNQTNQTEEQGTFTEVVRAIDAQEMEPERHIAVQMDEAVREAILAARGSGKNASVTVKLNVVPGIDRRVSFSAVVSSKLPKPSANLVTLFSDAEGNLHRQDPNQTRLDFTDAAPRRTAKDN